MVHLEYLFTSITPKWLNNESENCIKKDEESEFIENEKSGTTETSTNSQNTKNDNIMVISQGDEHVSLSVRLNWKNDFLIYIFFFLKCRGDYCV